MLYVWSLEQEVIYLGTLHFHGKVGRAKLTTIL